MPILVRNISSGGLMGECVYPARCGERVEIELTWLGIVVGRIRWGGSRRLGVQFEGPIDPMLAWPHVTQWHPPIDFPPIDPWRPGVLPH